MPQSSERAVPAALVAGLDLLAVAVFAAAGMRSHDEDGGLVEVLVIAWPFATGVAVGWCGYVAVRGRAPVTPAAGLWVALCALVGGHVLRVVSGRGTEPSFVVVSAIVLVLLLVGCRAVASYVVRRRR